MFVNDKDFVFAFQTDEVPTKLRSRFSRDRRKGYTPEKTRKLEKYIKEEFAKWYPKPKQIKGAVAVRVHVYAPLPKSKPKRIKCEDNTVKPDADNIAKVVLDALNGIAYEDDRQVVDLTCIKYPRVRPKDKGAKVLTVVLIKDVSAEDYNADFAFGDPLEDITNY